MTDSHKFFTRRKMYLYGTNHNSDNTQGIDTSHTSPLRVHVHTHAYTKVLPLVACSSASELVLVAYLRLAVLGGGGGRGGALPLDFEPSVELERRRLPRRLNLLNSIVKSLTYQCN